MLKTLFCCYRRIFLRLGFVYIEQLDKEEKPMAKVFSGENPSQMYIDALTTLLQEGDIVAPRGKRVKELRPVILEFLNPLNRVTFLKGRKINPFFQMAEAVWILAGRADVDWLTKYNRNMAQFSDDGVFFNAPYGERLRAWNGNSYRNFVFNPFDQLEDAYQKILKDTDTRQAVAVIYNPLFDNVTYGGKDTPCNLILTFKVRNGKLDLTVFNRSNDIHWGTFGANLCQFTTIQEVMATWLDIPVGKYSVASDSFHVYLDDYGAKETNKILEAYGMDLNSLQVTDYRPPEVKHFTFENEPRMSLKFDEFDSFMQDYFRVVDPIIHNDDNIKNSKIAREVIDLAGQSPDEYFKNSFYAMIAYRAHRLDNKQIVVEALDNMQDSQWKLSCLYFLYNKYKDNTDFKNLYAHYDSDMKEYIEGQ